MADEKKEEKKLNPDEIKALLKKSRIKDANGWEIQYKLEIDSPFEKPEKFYGLALNELRIEFDPVIKVDQALNASPTSAFFGDISQRRAYAKENVDKSMGLINGIVQQVVKLIYSLREFDSVLDI
ncbi:MAG: hypothetical protein PHN56_06295, partial [Candidatus Nanoarchaeia archaeon]|nr:hypothetical protein [Candidatus Nanoarchaeia archaeon]